MKKKLKVKSSASLKTSADRQKSKFVFAVGRRKTAVARVRLFKGKGEILVNGKPIGEYFPGEAMEALYLKPFLLTNTVGKYRATIKVEGSGKNGQLGAVIHGLARALNNQNPSGYHAILKKHKLLTRDSRAREKRKIGTGGKARRKKQSPKR